MRMKKIFKKLVALGAGAGIFCAGMGGAMAAANLNTLGAGGLMISEGAFDAHVVVGPDSKPSDIIGAIDVAAAFAQKAQRPASIGSAIISVQTYEGGTQTVATLQNQTTPLEVGYGTAKNDAIANYTIEVNDTLNFTTVQKVSLTEASALIDNKLRIEKGKIVMEISALKNDALLDASTISGSFMKLFGDEKYIVDWISGTNVTLGSSEKHADIALGSSMETKLETLDGYKIRMQSTGTVDKIILKVEAPDGTSSELKELSEGESFGFGDVTIVLDEVIGASWASITVVASKEEIRDGDEYPIEGWEVKVADGKLVIKNKEVIELDGVSFVDGPKGEFRIDFVELDQTGDSCIIEIKEGQLINGAVAYNGSDWLVSGFYSSILKSATAAKMKYNLWTDVFNSKVADGEMLRVIEPDGSYFQFNLTKTANPVYESNPFGAVYFNDSDTIILDAAKLPFYSSSGINVTEIDASNIAIKEVGTEIVVTADLSDQGDNAKAGTFYIRKDIDGIYDGSEEKGPFCYGVAMSFDASDGDADDKLTIMEPNGFQSVIYFNDTDKGILFKEADLPENEENSTYDSAFYYNKTTIENDVYDGANGNITIKVPESFVKFGVGAYQFSEETSLSVGDAVKFDETTVKLDSVSGMEIVPITPGIGVMSTDFSKPVILVGGPEANPLVEEFVSIDEFKTDGEFVCGKAIVKLAERMEQPVLIIAGVCGDDTTKAAREVAAEILGKTSVLSGEEAWLDFSNEAAIEVNSRT